VPAAGRLPPHGLGGIYRQVNVRFYLSPAGRCPVQDYLDELSDEEAAPVFTVLARLAQEGLSAPVVKRQIDGKLWELKPGPHRVFYVLVTGPEMVLLHAYRKKSQKAPKAEIETAKRRAKEVLAQEREP
jgi:phage-related protein